MTLDDFVRRSIGVPFLIGGRDYTGWDCWGLILIAYRDVFKIQLGSYSDEYNEDVTYNELANLIDAEKPSWVPVVGKPRDGDVSLYRIGRHSSHVALVVRRTGMLHCECRVNTLLEPLDNILWKNRHVAYYRHAALT